jgi:hypothetical protein
LDLVQPIAVEHVLVHDVARVSESGVTETAE